MSAFLKNLAGKGGESTPTPNSVSNVAARSTPVMSPDAESPKKKDNPKYWQFYRVAGKTREAKFLQLPFRPGTIDEGETNVSGLRSLDHLTLIII